MVIAFAFGVLPVLANTACADGITLADMARAALLFGATPFVAPGG
ncbi:MAG TPA: hypothetical protein VMS38_33510 [Pseudorhodoferax sp.]|jgi:Mg2+/citrate symporter|nr:hypothetical protein [Pseudorhodoferax sp.]